MTLSLDAVHENAKAVVDRLLPGLLVRAARSTFESQVPQDGTLEVAGQLSVKAGLDANTRAVSCAVTYHLMATRDGDPTSKAWEVELEVNGQWQVESVADLTDDQLRSFAMKVGLMALHPYARAHIQTAISASGWPPYALDVITSPDAIFGVDEAGHVDLEGVSVTRVD
jgi:preprotein translocase subunit SecB